MNVEQLKSAIQYAYSARQPLMAWGAPGLGKSSAYKQATDEMKIGLIDLRLSLLEPIDLRGMFYVDSDKKEKVTRWARPPFLPTVGKGIILLDELPQAHPSMQAAASQLVLDGRIGEHEIGAGWMTMAAGNRTTDRAAANVMPTHIANRFMHATIDADLDIWVHWALTHDIDIRVIAFLKFRPALLHSFDPSLKQLAFPSPRSWQGVSKMITGTATLDPIRAELIRGEVGEGAGAEAVGFFKVYEKMPSIDGIILNPTSANVPTDAAVLYAVTTALGARATKDNIGKVATYFNRISDAGRPEFAVAAMKELSRVKTEICHTKPFIEWAAKHNHLLA